MNAIGRLVPVLLLLAAAPLGCASADDPTSAAGECAPGDDTCASNVADELATNAASCAKAVADHHPAPWTCVIHHHRPQKRFHLHHRAAIIDADGHQKGCDPRIMKDDATGAILGDRECVNGRAVLPPGDYAVYLEPRGPHAGIAVPHNDSNIRVADLGLSHDVNARYWPVKSDSLATADREWGWHGGRPMPDRSPKVQVRLHPRPIDPRLTFFEPGTGASNHAARLSLYDCDVSAATTISLVKCDSDHKTIEDPDCHPCPVGSTDPVCNQPDAEKSCGAGTDTILMTWSPPVTGILDGGGAYRMSIPRGTAFVPADVEEKRIDDNSPPNPGAGGWLAEAGEVTGYVTFWYGHVTIDGVRYYGWVPKEHSDGRSGPIHHYDH